MSPSIIISTYNHPKWLEKCLYGYLFQSHGDFEILVADDGSNEDTRAVIDAFSKEAPFSVRHVWQKDEGFQKSRILNKAILEAEGDYLIFTDGDCIPRPDFVETHLKLACQGHFLSGGYCKLPEGASEHIQHDDISSGRAFELKWLIEQGLGYSSSRLKLSLNGHFAEIADRWTPTNATWNGCNSSTWKDHIISVNGHDETMQYGGQDREMGSRLINYGIQPIQIRHRAILLHLHHKRGYKTEESLAKNLAIRKETERSGRSWSENGMQK